MIRFSKIVDGDQKRATEKKGYLGERMALRKTGILSRDKLWDKDIMDKAKIESLILKIYKQKIDLPSNFIQSLQNLETCLEKRISQGSPSISEVKKIIEILDKKKEIFKNKFLKRVEKIKDATIQREDTIKKLIA